MDPLCTVSLFKSSLKDRPEGQPQDIIGARSFGRVPWQDLRAEFLDRISWRKDSWEYPLFIQVLRTNKVFCKDTFRPFSSMTRARSAEVSLSMLKIRAAPRGLRWGVQNSHCVFSKFAEHTLEGHQTRPGSAREACAVETHMNISQAQGCASKGAPR